jgi:DNA-binding response OmpR family regulator
MVIEGDGFKLRQRTPEVMNIVMPSDSHVPVDSETERMRTLTRGSVLLVEDDDDIRMRMEALLGHAVFDVLSVRSVQEARDVMEAIVFPIVIIDRLLGLEDGIQLVREFRERYNQHRVFLVLYSALDSSEERERGLRAGADAYLSKSGSEDLLLKTLTDARASVRLVAR